MSTPQGPQGPQSKAPGRGAPGAMTMAMQAVDIKAASGPKVLRIGVIQQDRMVEERVVRKRETVNVGSSERNHFVVAGLPATYPLFELVGSDYILNFTDEMRGKVGLAGGVQELSQLRASGAARNAGAYWQVKLNDQSRGRVSIGDTTLLFQFIDPPPVQTRPQLPAAVMQGFTAGIDWLFTAFVMFSFMSHFGFIIFLENADWPMPPSLSTIPPELIETLVEPMEPEPVEAPVEDTGEEAEEAEEVAEASDSSSSDSEASDAPSSESERAAADSDARMAAEDAMAAVDMMLLGALGGESGALADVLAGGAVTGSAADVMATADGVGVASGGATGLRERGGGSAVGGATAGLGGLAAAGGSAGRAREEGGTVTEAAPRGRFRAVSGADDESGSGDFDVQAVIRLINTRRAAITRCYETQLRSDPTLSGRVAVSMTIQESGSVTNVRATENTTGSDEVASCVVRVISGFRFNPGPEGGSVSYSFPFVFEPSG